MQQLQYLQPYIRNSFMSPLRNGGRRDRRDKHPGDRRSPAQGINYFVRCIHHLHILGLPIYKSQALL